MNRLSSRAGQVLFFPLVFSLMVPLSSANATVAPVAVATTPASKVAVSSAATASTAASNKPVKPRHAVKPQRKNHAASSKTGKTTRPAGVALKSSPTLASAPLKLAPWHYVPPSAVMAAPAMAAPVIAVAAETPAAPARAVAPAFVNPYLVNVTPRGTQVQSAPVVPQQQAAAPMSSIPAFSLPKFALPEFPSMEQSILPKVTKVYPTGEKPLVVVSFKCPTELIGIDTPSTKLLHMGVEGGMDLLNRSNLLSFNMQSVCQ